MQLAIFFKGAGRKSCTFSIHARFKTTERFAVERMRAHDLWHDQHRLMRKVLAHTMAVFLNLQMGHQPLDLDGLVTA